MVPDVYSREMLYSECMYQLRLNGDIIWRDPPFIKLAFSFPMHLSDDVHLKIFIEAAMLCVSFFLALLNRSHRVAQHTTNVKSPPRNYSRPCIRHTRGNCDVELDRAFNGSSRLSSGQSTATHPLVHHRCRRRGGTRPGDKSLWTQRHSAMAANPHVS